MNLETNPKKPSGLLNVPSIPKGFTLTLHPPAPDLEPFVEHHWIVNWDLRGREPFVSENLPHPSVHLVLERGQFGITGVVKEKFSRTLEGSGFVFGVKFRPGGFYPFVNTPVSRFTGHSIPGWEVFGEELASLEASILSQDDEKHRVALAEAFLRGRRPVPDETLELLHTMITAVTADRTLASVEDLADRFHCSPRWLQRTFGKYVGVSPKWVIQRYRLLEVADQLANGHPESWPELAAGLGYYDQSHFIKDFKCIVGRSPEEYVRKNS